MSGILAVLALALILSAGAVAASKTKVLHIFKGKDGAGPSASLILDAVGNLYGTTGGGGDCCGTVFKLTANADGSWTESLLYSFTGGADGAGPSGSLIFDAAGNLYGTTASGGEFGWGTVFKLTPNADGSWTESLLHVFSGQTDGAFPFAGLIFDAAGNLYGTALEGGNSTKCGVTDTCGMVFELKPNSDGSWTESVLYNFCSVTNCADGAASYASLTFDVAGIFTVRLIGVGAPTVLVAAASSSS
jgi:uncharacterized repeat protein (TIGR03803 family)